MPARLLLPPSVEPVTLDHIKAHLRVQHAAEDGLIAGYLSGVRDVFERIANRALIAQTWELTLSCWPSEIILPCPPLIRVESITYRDYANTLQTLATSQYVVDSSSPDRPARIVPAYGVIWPILYDTPNAIQIEYSAGFAIPVTASPTTDLFSTDYECADGDRITLSVVSEDVMGLTPLRAGRFYYVVGASGGSFQIALTPGGSAINITGPLNTGQLFIGWIPEGVRNFIKIMTAHAYENREPVNIGNIVNEMPLAAESLLYAYRVMEAV